MQRYDEAADIGSGWEPSYLPCVQCGSSLIRNRFLPESTHTVCWRHRDTSVEQADVIEAERKAEYDAKVAAEKADYEAAVAGFADRARWEVANLMAHSAIMTVDNGVVHLSRGDYAKKGYSLAIDPNAGSTKVPVVSRCVNCHYFNPSRNMKNVGANKTLERFSGLPCGMMPTIARYNAPRVHETFQCRLFEPLRRDQ